jgi:hypothetical protein
MEGGYGGGRGSPRYRGVNGGRVGMLLTIMTGPLPPGMLTIMVSLDGPPWGDVNPMTYTNKVINMSGVMYSCYT